VFLKNNLRRWKIKKEKLDEGYAGLVNDWAHCA